MSNEHGTFLRWLAILTAPVTLAIRGVVWAAEMLAAPFVWVSKQAADAIARWRAK